MIRLPPDFTLLQVTPALDTGGVEQTTLDIAAAVKRAGGRALVATSGGRLEGALAAVGGELIRLPVQSKNPVAMLSNVSKLKQVIGEARVSIVHVRSRAPAFAALWAARETRTPLVATYHGVYNARTAPKRWYNAVMTRGDLVIANSDYTRAHVLAQHEVDPAKVIAIPRGIDLARFDPAAVSPERLAAIRAAWGLAEGDARTVILCAARLTRWKGQGLLVEAVQRLKARGQSDFVVILAGDDQGREAYRAQLETAIGAAGLEDQVRLVGHCEDMPAAYLAADIAVAPSLEPEAFGRTAVEPQAMGRPVVAAAHGAALETVVDGETGWLAAPGDSTAWADALAAAIASGPNKRARMGRQGRARAHEFYSVETMAEATLAAYLGLLGRWSR